jgi:hypothetical protein
MMSAYWRRRTLVALWAAVSVLNVMLLTASSGYPAMLRALPVAIMEWAVLQFCARIGWVWIPVVVAATYGFDALFPLVFRWFGQPLSGFNNAFLIINILTAIPPAAVLAYYTRRGWLWIAAAPMGYAFSRAWFAVLGPASFSEGISVSAVAPRLIVGVLEGLLLAYILEGRIHTGAQATVPQRSADNEPEPASAPFPIGAAVLMTISLIGFGIVGLVDWPERDRSIGSFSQGIALSHIAGLALLCRRRTRAIGAGLGFGAALIATPPTVYFGGVMMLLGAIVSIIPLLILSQLGMLVAGFVAVRRFAASGRSAAWLAGILVPLMLVIALTAVSSQRRETRTNARRDADRAYRELQATVQLTVDCLRDRETAGYPQSRADLLSACAAAKSLPPDARYWPGRRDAAAAISGFTLCATTPAGYDDRIRAVAADARGLWTSGIGVLAPRACAGAWSERPGGLLHCVLEFEATNAGNGFPASIKDIGPDGTNCLAYERASAAHSVETSEYRLTYVAGDADSSGRIVGFQIIGLPKSSIHPKLLTDETAVWRQTMDDRMARSDDPPWPPPGNQPSFLNRTPEFPDPTPEQLKTACDRGELAACGDIGSGLVMVAANRSSIVPIPPADQNTLTAEANTMRAAIALLTRACNGGVASSCSNLGQALSFTKHDNAAVIAALTRGCELGDADSCMLAAAQPVTIESRARLWERACALGHFLSCTDLAVAYQSGDGVARDPVRADRIMRLACAGSSDAGCGAYR